MEVGWGGGGGGFVTCDFDFGGMEGGVCGAEV